MNTARSHRQNQTQLDLDSAWVNLSALSKGEVQGLQCRISRRLFGSFKCLLCFALVCDLFCRDLQRSNQELTGFGVWDWIWVLGLRVLALKGFRGQGFVLRVDLLRSERVQDWD